MTIYWIIFVIPALAAIVQGNSRAFVGAKLYWTFCAVLIAIVGLRYRVGPDWDNYLAHLDTVSASSASEAIRTSDSAYWLLNWFANYTGQGVWLINVICATIYLTGLFCLSRRTSNPWLGVTVAIPFMVIVLGMNYTRQSAALGFVFYAIIALERGKSKAFGVLGIAASIFHKSAVVTLPLGAFAATSRRLVRWLAVAALTGIAYVLFLEKSATSLTENYIEGQMISDGTVVRVLMNVLGAGCVFIVVANREISPAARKFWIRYSLSTIPFFIAIIVLPPLTVIDRLALYWTPLQIYAFAHLPGAFKRWGVEKLALAFIIGCYALVQFIWLTYANFSFAWKPYRFYPLEALFHRVQ
jgi:hypothetical protein